MFRCGRAYGDKRILTTAESKQDPVRVQQMQAIPSAGNPIRTIICPRTSSKWRNGFVRHCLSILKLHPKKFTSEPNRRTQVALGFIGITDNDPSFSNQP